MTKTKQKSEVRIGGKTFTLRGDTMADRDMAHEALDALEEDGLDLRQFMGNQVAAAGGKNYFSGIDLYSRFRKSKRMLILMRATLRIPDGFDLERFVAGWMPTDGEVCLRECLPPFFRKFWIILFGSESIATQFAALADAPPEGLASALSGSGAGTPSSK